MDRDMRRFAGKFSKNLPVAKSYRRARKGTGFFSPDTPFPSSLETRQWMLTLVSTGGLDLPEFYSFSNSQSISFAWRAPRLTGHPA